MGYITNVYGELISSPPLTWSEFKDSPFYAPNGKDRDVKLVVSEVRVETEDGSLVRRTATGLATANEDEGRARHLIEHVQEAVDAFPGHTWSGRLECEGEENTDMWRVVIRDGRAVRIEPTITWPSDSGEDV